MQPANWRRILSCWSDYIYNSVTPWLAHYELKEMGMFTDLLGYRFGSKRVLEAGCGTGLVGALLHKSGADVVLLDCALPALKAARDHAVKLDTDPCLVLADIFHMPFREEAFDIVWSEGVIEHFQNPRIILLEQMRAVRRGGTILVMTPNKFSFHTIIWRPLLRSIGRFPFDSWGKERSYSPKELAKLLSRVGASNIRTLSNNVARNLIDDHLLTYAMRHNKTTSRFLLLIKGLIDRLESSSRSIRNLGFIVAAAGEREKESGKETKKRGRYKFGKY